MEDEDQVINNPMLGCRLYVCVWGGVKWGGLVVCCFKWRFPSRGLNAWPRELDGFISLGADRVYRVRGNE